MQCVLQSLFRYSGTRRGAVSWGTALQATSSCVRFPMVSLEFFIDILLPTVLWPPRNFRTCRGGGSFAYLNYGWSKKVKVKLSRYMPGMAQRVGRGIALLFHDRGTRRGWVVSSTPRPHVTPGKDPVPIVQEAGWAPGPVWTGGKSRPHRDSTPGRPARSQSLYRLSYPVHNYGWSILRIFKQVWYFS